LLNEIHGNCESQGIPFAITGSSARKLKRADANLLAGRALRLNFFPLVWAEIPDESRLEGCIEFGTLPSIVDSPSLAADIRWAYVETFLVEEIAAEALTRSLEAFARFINTAAQYHGQLLNIEAIARESSVKRRSADKYLHILEDTLIGFRLPAKSLGVRAKEAAHPKFYFLDAGVARAASGWLRESVPDVWQGFSFESHVLNEIRAYNSYQKKDKNIFHYSITGSFDIDFLIETNKKFLDQKPSYIAIEVKLAKTWRSEWSKLLIDFKEISDALKGFKNNMTRVEVHFHEIKRNKDSGADKYSAFEAKR
jgi:predicted AAA+ superfamily ATPase